MIRASVRTKLLLLLALGALPTSGVAANPPTHRGTSTAHPPLQRPEAAHVGPVVPAGTQSFLDLAYVPNGHVRQKLDLYVPSGGGPFPVIVYIHGGGWRRGDRKSNLVPIDLTTSGYAVASIDYRYSSDAIFPAQIEDCLAAVRWLRASSTQYRLDGEHFASWGESAGAHLAALVGTAGTSKNQFEVGGNLRLPSSVQAVVDYYGPTDFLQMDAHRLPGGVVHDIPGSAESQLVGGRISTHERRVHAANPITYVSASTPPFLIAHGDGDLTVPPNQSELMKATLERQHVPVTLTVIPGAGHMFEGAAPADLAALHQKTVAFLDRYLKSTGTSHP